MFVIRTERTLGFGVSNSIKGTVARRVAAGGEFSDVIVDGFFDMLEGERVVADLGRKIVVAPKSPAGG